MGLLLAVLVGAPLVGCGGRGAAEYTITPDVVGENRALLIERFEKGKVLYKANCSVCHGIYAQGRDSVPNFSDAQIHDYNATYMKGDQRNHAVARRLSQQQVDYIMTFLRLRRRPAAP